MNRKNILIIANGELPAVERLKKLSAGSEVIIAADGGSNRCAEHGLRPDYIVGDMDSIGDAVLVEFRDIPLIHRPDQNRHDLDKTLEFALSLQPSEIHVAGAFGGRNDHTVANLLLLQNWAGCPVWYHDGHGRMTVLEGGNSLDLPVGTLVSLFAFLPVTGVSLTGFRYPLSGQDFPAGFNGLSNVIEKRPAEISIDRGRLIMYVADEQH